MIYCAGSVVRNNFAGLLVVEAVGVRFFAPGTTPEMPLRAATCREAQDGHRPCEAAGHLFGAGGFVNSGGRPKIRRGPCELLACYENTRPRLRQHRTGLPRRKPFSACSIRIDGNLDEIAIQIPTIVRHHLSEGP